MKERVSSVLRKMAERKRMAEEKTRARRKRRRGGQGEGRRAFWDM